MKKIIVAIVAGMVFGYVIGDKAHEDVVTASQKPGTDYVWSNLVEVPTDRAGADTWFQQEYDALEWSWQKMVRKYDHMQLPEDMAADVITFHYLPWTEELKRETESRSLPHSDLKLQVLDERIESLTALEEFYIDYKDKDFKTYKKHDSKFREIIKEHPEVFD